MNKKTVLAMTTALLLAGSAATSASAQYHRSYDDYGRYDGRSTWIAYDRDCDGVLDRYDRRISRDAHDADCDGVPNRYDHRYDRRRVSHRDWQTSHRQRWSVGAYLPREYYGSSYYIDYEPYGLNRPPYGYRWNRVGDDVYLVETRNGLVVEVRYDAFH